MFAAFCVYAEMGSERSLKAVAKKIGHPIGTVEGWSKKHGWQERVLDLQKQANEAAGEKLKDRMFESVEKLREFKNTILEELKTKFHTAAYCGDCGSHRLTVAEMINILNVVKVELGEPTNITKNTNPNPNNDPFALLLTRMFPPSASITITPNADAKPN